MSCVIHSEPDNENGECPACIAKSPPDLGVATSENTQTSERIS
jgi:hypothetical protein